MKNIGSPKTIISSLFTTLLLLAVYACGSKGDEMVQHYDTGEIQRTYTLIDGKKEGKMTDYYKDGKIKSERMFENDIEVGKTVFYYPGGQVKEVQYFLDGKMHGGDTVFYEDGSPQFVRPFNKGMLDGYLRKWNENDSLIYEAKYAGDTLVEVKGVPLYPDSLNTDIR